MAQFCSHCGSQFPSNMDFCPECGAKIGISHNRKNSARATASMVIGIVSIGISIIMIPLTFVFRWKYAVILLFLDFAAAVTGFVLSCVSLKCTSRTKAQSGFVLTLPALILTFAAVIVYFILLLCNIF